MLCKDVWIDLYMELGYDLAKVVAGGVTVSTLLCLGRSLIEYEEVMS